MATLRELRSKMTTATRLEVMISILVKWTTTIGRFSKRMIIDSAGRIWCQANQSETFLSTIISLELSKKTRP